MKIMNCSVKKTKKLIGKVKLETYKTIWIDECVCLRLKTHSFKCKDSIESKNKIKAFSRSQSKHVEFEE